MIYIMFSKDDMVGTFNIFRFLKWHWDKKWGLDMI